jgi:CheY-like chemotaxis protein
MSDSELHTILIVDDTPANIDLLVGVLQDKYNIKIATSGAEALKKVRQEKPDLILLDVMMPKMSGYETCRRLKENSATREIPVIFVTALANDRDKTQGFDVGAVDYITKPINVPRVRAKVKTHLALSLRENTGELANTHNSSANGVAGQIVSAAVGEQSDSSSELNGNLPGLDLDRGLKSLDGNDSLYRKLLAGFLRDYADAAVKIKTSLAEGDQQEVHRSTHTIKGLAGNFGAFSLQKAAELLEQAVASKNNSNLDELLTHFSGQLDRVMASIKLLPARVDEEQKQDEIRNIDQIRIQLDILDELLKNNDFQAVSHFAELKSSLQALSLTTDLTILEQHIETFAFKHASEELAAVEHKIIDVLNSILKCSFVMFV